MKKEVFHSILQNLSPEEKGRVDDYVRRYAQSKRQQKVFKLARSMTELDQLEIAEQVDLKYRSVEHHFRVLASMMVAALIGENKSTQLQSEFELAKRLAKRLREDLAIPLLEGVMLEAQKNEAFALIEEVWRFARTLLLPFPRAGTQSEKRIWTFEQYQRKSRLLRELSRLSDLANRMKIPESFVGEKPAIIKELERSILFDDRSLKESELTDPEDDRHSKSATEYYFKAKAIYFFVLKDYLKAFEYLEKTIELFEKSSWLVEGRREELLKEYRVKAYFLIRMKRYSEAREVVFRVGQMEPRSERAKLEKQKMVHPALLADAIQRGKTEVGMDEFTRTLRVCDQFSDADPSFETRCLYYCIYFSIAIRDFQTAGELQERCQAMPENAFTSIRWQMLFVLELVILFEQEMFGKIDNKLRNLKNRFNVPASSYLMFVLTALSELNATPVSSRSLRAAALAEKAEELEEENISSKLYFDFFNIQIWLESKAKNCPMAEIFRHRAKTEDSFWESVETSAYG